MSPTLRAIVVILFFIFVFLSGIGLSRLGRPLSVAVSTIHKLISLAAGIFLLVTIYQRNQVVPLGSIEWILIGGTGLCFLGTVASGGILTSDKPAPGALRRAHQVLPVLTALSSAGMLYLLLSG